MRRLTGAAAARAALLAASLLFAVVQAGPTPQYAEALVTKGPKIVFVGGKAEAAKAAGPGARTHDLKNRTLLPGFVDSHAHFLYASRSLLGAQLRGSKSIAELLQRLKVHANTVPEGAWIEGQGYSVATLKEARPPTAEELDQVSSTRPMFVVDGSGHQGVVNTAVMRQLGITAKTPDPEGGKYYRKAGSNEPDGGVAESVTMELYSKRPPLKPEQIKRAVKLASDVWLSNGYTTASELGVGLNSDDPLVAKAIVDDNFLLHGPDLVLYIKASAVEQARKVAQQTMRGHNSKGGVGYLNRVKIGGIKHWLDGSPPNALTKMYVSLPVGVTGKLVDYHGVQVDPTADVERTFMENWKEGPLQVAAHVMGDDAAEIVIRAMEKAAAKQGPTTKRHVLQHAGMIRPDQLPRIKRLGAMASFTGGGIYEIGDYVVSLFGDKVGSILNSAGSFGREGIPYSINTDYPAGNGPSLLVAMADMVERRIAKSGKIFGPGQRIGPYEGLRAMTLSGAYMHGEEKSKGTLEAGKLADMVVLDRNPLKVPHAQIRDLVVLETIKEGRTLFSRPAPARQPAPSVPDVSPEALDGTAEGPALPGKLPPAGAAAVNELLATAGRKLRALVGR